jgi:hypothetical protein
VRGCCEHGSKPSVPITAVKLLVTELVLASQEGFSCVELGGWSPNGKKYF